MLDPRSGAVRGARAGVLALTAVAVAGAAHTLLDGCLDLAGLLLALSVCWPAAVAVLGARRRLPALLVWAVGAQVVTHVLVALTCGDSPAVPARARALHALAMVVTTALLARADAGLWTAHALLRTVGRLLPRRRPRPALPRPRRFLVSPQVTVLLDRWHACPRALRGPPSGSPLTA